MQHFSFKFYLHVNFVRNCNSFLDLFRFEVAVALFYTAIVQIKTVFLFP